MLEAPINRAVPTFVRDESGITHVKSWRWDEWFTGKKWTTTNEESRQLTPVCLDLASYNRAEIYGKELKKYVEFLEKALEKCRAKN